MNIEIKDKRIRYTRMFLKDALIALMQEKSVDQISVTELCAKADIHRNTFYSHFNNVRDVLVMLENELEDELIRNLNLNLNSKEVICQLFENIHKYGSIYRLLLSSNGDHRFMQNLYMKVEKIVIDEFKKQKIDLDDKKYEMLFEFLFMGCMSIVRRWLDTGEIQSPHSMADFVYNIAASSVEPFRKF